MPFFFKPVLADGLGPFAFGAIYAATAGPDASGLSQGVSFLVGAGCAVVALGLVAAMRGAPAATVATRA